MRMVRVHQQDYSSLTAASVAVANRRRDRRVAGRQGHPRRLVRSPEDDRVVGLGPVGCIPPGAWWL